MEGTKSASAASPASVVKRLLPFIRAERAFLALAFVAGVVKFAAPLLITDITARLIDDVILDNQLGAEERLRHTALYVAFIVLVFALIWAPATYFRQYLAELITIRITSSLRIRLFSHVLDLPFAYFQERRSGEITSRMVSDVAATASLASGGLIYVWIDLASVMVVVALVLLEDLYVGAMSLVSLPLYLYLMRYFRGRVKDISHEVQAALGDLSGYLQERVGNIDVVQSANAQEYETGAVDARIGRHVVSFMRRSRVKSLNVLVMGQLTQLPSVVVLAVGGYEVIAGGLSVGSFVAITMYIRQIFWPLDRVADFNVNFAAAAASLDRIYDILGEKTASQLWTGTQTIDGQIGRLEFRNVSARYKDGGPSAVASVSFVVERGEVVAVCGPSGSGKTTIARLLDRTIPCVEGAIIADEENIAAFSLKSWRRVVRTVHQNPILFSDTVRNNVAYPDQSTSERDIWRACDAAGASAFIAKLPGGLDYEVGERGSRLSGGQRQRIAIARALVSKPEVLIFDESTSNLDAETERAFYEALAEIHGRQTILIIAHRPAAFDFADRVLLMENGAVVDTGRPADLLERSALFRRLVGSRDAAE